jgi:SMC interacting uncharacterized protein involved in chromosome segregation
MIPDHILESYHTFKRNHPELNTELDRVIQYYVAEATMTLATNINSLDTEVAKLKNQISNIPILTKSIAELEKTIKALTERLSADDSE